MKVSYGLAWFGGQLWGCLWSGDCSCGRSYSSETKDSILERRTRQGFVVFIDLYLMKLEWEFLNLLFMKCHATQRCYLLELTAVECTVKEGEFEDLNYLLGFPRSRAYFAKTDFAILEIPDCYCLIPSLKVSDFKS